MPHESTVDPEEPMHFKSWGEENPQTDSPDRRRSIFGPQIGGTPRLNPSLSIHTYPDLPSHVTHDHDNDGDPDEEEETSVVDTDGDLEQSASVTYTPPTRKIGQAANGEEHKDKEN